MSVSFQQNSIGGKWVVIITVKMWIKSQRVFDRAVWPFTPQLRIEVISVYENIVAVLDTFLYAAVAPYCLISAGKWYRRPKYVFRCGRARNTPLIPTPSMRYCILYTVSKDLHSVLYQLFYISYYIRDTHIRGKNVKKDRKKTESSHNATSC